MWPWSSIFKDEKDYEKAKWESITNYYKRFGAPTYCWPSQSVKIEFDHQMWLNQMPYRGL